MAESPTTSLERRGKKLLKRQRSSSDAFFRPDMSQDEEPQKRKRLSSYELLPPNMKLNVVLLGNSQSGRNEVGDFLLGQTVFSGHDALTDCMIGSGQVEKTQMVVINTPDLLHPNITPIELSEKVQNCVKHCDPGPLVFLLVLQPEDFTEEQRHKLQNVLQEFSDRPFDHSLVLVLTPKKKRKGPMINYMRHPQLNEIIRKCSYRHLQQKNLEHLELLTRLGQVVKENNGQSGLTMTTKINPLNIVLIGKTGVGKSTSGNTILNQQIFPSKSSPSSLTKDCQKENGEVDGRTVVVVDTPGLFDQRLSREDIDRGIIQCIKLLDLGLHVFLLVLKIDTFTEENKETVKLIQTTLGKNANKFTIILFTGGDSLENDKQSIEDYIHNSHDDSLRNLIDECGGRYHVFNNYDKNNRKQVSDLLMKVEKMVKENRGGRYTTKIFKEPDTASEIEVQDEMKREMEALKRTHEEDLEVLKRTHEEEMRRKQREWKDKFRALDIIRETLEKRMIEQQEASEMKRNLMIEELMERKEDEMNYLREEHSSPKGKKRRSGRNKKAA